MGIEIKNAYAAQLAATDTTVYTCPLKTAARVLKCTACNDTTTVVTFNANKVPSGGSVAVTNLILNTKALGSKETYECPEVVGQVLDAGDIISMVGSGADQVTIIFDVVEIV